MRDDASRSCNHTCSLIDDHALFRESVVRVLSENPGLEIEHCASIREALLLIAEQRFDLVLLDHDLEVNARRSLPLARQAGFDGASWW